MSSEKVNFPDQGHLLDNLRLTGLGESEIAEEMALVMDIHQCAAGAITPGHTGNGTGYSTWAYHELYDGQYFCTYWAGGPGGRLVITLAPGISEVMTVNYHFYPYPGPMGRPPKLLQWDDGEWSKNDSLTCQPLPGYILTILAVAADRFDVYTVDPITATIIYISRNNNSVLWAKSAAQRWWREKIEALYE